MALIGLKLVAISKIIRGLGGDCSCSSSKTNEVPGERSSPKGYQSWQHEWRVQLDKLKPSSI